MHTRRHREGGSGSQKRDECRQGGGGQVNFGYIWKFGYHQLEGHWDRFIARTHLSSGVPMTNSMDMELPKGQ